jgi:hypothetical protein
MFCRDVGHRAQLAQAGVAVQFLCTYTDSSHNFFFCHDCSCSQLFSGIVLDICSEKRFGTCFPEKSFSEKSSGNTKATRIFGWLISLGFVFGAKG